jgi:hypothetical protein
MAPLPNFRLAQFSFFLPTGSNSFLLGLLPIASSFLSHRASDLDDVALWPPLFMLPFAAVEVIICLNSRGCRCTNDGFVSLIVLP